MDGMTRKQQLALERMNRAAANKRLRRARFIAATAKKQGILVETSATTATPYLKVLCQSPHRQLVREVVKMAGVYLYRSSACSGCIEGRDHLTNKKPAQPDEIKGCVLIRENWLVSLVPVEVGDVVEAQDPADFISKHKKRPRPEPALEGRWTLVTNGFGVVTMGNEGAPGRPWMTPETPVLEDVIEDLGDFDEDN